MEKKEWPTEYKLKVLRKLQRVVEKKGPNDASYLCIIACNLGFIYYMTVSIFRYIFPELHLELLKRQAEYQSGKSHSSNIVDNYKKDACFDRNDHKGRIELIISVRNIITNCTTM